MTDQAAPAAAPAAAQPRPDNGPPPPLPPMEEAAPPEFGPTDAQLIADWNAKVAAVSSAPGNSVAPAAPAAAPAAPAPDATTPPPATPPPADDIDARIKAYVARQADDVMASVKLKQERDALQAERDRVAAEHAALLERLKADPLGTVKETAGEDFEALAHRAVRGNSPEFQAIQAMKAEVAKLRQEAAARDAAAQAAEQARQVQAFRSSVMPSLEQKRDDYPHMLALMEPSEVPDAVLGVVQRAYSESNGARLLSIHEAAALLEAGAKARFERMRPLVTAATTPPAQSSAAVPKPAAPRGLTNQVTQAAPQATEAEDLSDEALTAKAKAYWAQLQASKR